MVFTLAVALAFGALVDAPLAVGRSDIMASPRSARLLAQSDGVPVPPAASLSVRLTELDTAINHLERSKRRLGWPIAAIVGGSALFVLGAILGVYAFGVVGESMAVNLVFGALGLAAGVVLVIVGVLAVVARSKENAEIDLKVSRLKDDREKLEAQMRAPGVSFGPEWAPSSMVAVTHF
jgi:hypothetical protein